VTYLRVLVIDDDSDEANLRDILELDGYEVAARHARQRCGGTTGDGSLPSSWIDSFPTPPRRSCPDEELAPTPP
jgi:hypothetical protein